MAKEATTDQVKDPIKLKKKEFKERQKAARAELRKERLALYKKISATLRQRVIFGQAYGDLGDGKGFPMIGKVDLNKPGEIRISLYLLKSGYGKAISRTQNQICKERSLWFKPTEDKETNTRYLRIETDGNKTWEVSESNHFQTIIVKSNVVPKQAELDRLFDPQPLKLT